MFNGLVSVVKNWTVVGRLLILLVLSTNANGVEINNPKFFDYRGGSWANQLIEMSFGWFKTLDKEQSAVYNQSITHAVMYAENGQAVTWYQNDASGVSVPVMTWPVSDGYCRRMHIQVIAYNVEKTMAATACFSNSSNYWRWFN